MEGGLSFFTGFLEEMARIVESVSLEELEAVSLELMRLRYRKGRLFLVGLGGSAANASHAAADFRKLACINSICLSDSVAELTARANDEGWDVIFSDAMESQGACENDALMVFSVGGGTEEVSKPLVMAVKYAQEHNMPVMGIVGRDGGYTKRHGSAVVLIPTLSKDLVTPHTEAMHMVVVHCLISHPTLKRKATKW